MLQSKKLAGLLALAALPAMFWQTTASAGLADSYRPPSVVVLAQRALDKGKSVRALALLDGRIEGLRDSNHQAQAHALVCQALYQKKDYVAAEKSCDIAVSTGRPSWSHFNNRGVMRFALGRYGEALTDFRQAASTMLTASRQQSRSVRSNIAAAKRRMASR